MPGEDLYLDVAAFGVLIDTLDSAADDMKAANDRLADTNSGDLGNVGLDAAAGKFRDKWQYGIEQIAKSTASMADGLRTTRDLYVAQEQATADSITAVGSAIPDVPAAGSSLNL
ncbi:hypothetical protein DW322_11595 [Rhodococcus rhodnii]|uniref:Uncharacterized protein n=2 Tax=Rhodococcus rhodnii TaxID=38312 RepID=R7WLW7_9NOCA|nr:hypothetical protein [Rhodococcus rhodnii]EOM76280.1 hypothetical protein Rrhod_2380 [Rhodococcus rhodnii LMG 5362]TXG90748.1 hypothetical protein DW322_11595 [Rhodococcus rhodnii]